MMSQLAYSRTSRKYLYLSFTSITPPHLAMTTSASQAGVEVHVKYLRSALNEARKSPPKPTNFRVGCILVSFENPASPQIISTGYTLELPGNTHAEQCALSKLATSHAVPESSLSDVLTPAKKFWLYTSLEPCGKRLSGNTPCVQRIIATRSKDPEGGIRKVIFGAKEPGTFVKDSQSCKLLTEAGIEWEYVPSLEDEILRIAMEGHETKVLPQDAKVDSAANDKASEVKSQGTNVDDISPEERKRQEAAPRNPKKRMMEEPPR